MAPDIFWGEMGSLLICIMNAARMSWEAIFKSIKKMPSLSANFSAG